jgi:SAM-dependent methyltransferase
MTNQFDMTKQYDRAYFQRWYRDRSTRVTSDRALDRKVHVAVSAAEYMLGRRIRTVLDIGCGEARWCQALRQMRRGVEYVGLDPSDYAVEAFGVTRNVRHGSFGTLKALRLAGPYDLIVCADVLQYVPAPQLAAGLREIRRLLGGAAYIEAYAREDDMEGDMEGWHFRSAAEYRRHFRAAGLTHCGIYCFIDVKKFRAVNRFEVCK